MIHKILNANITEQDFVLEKEQNNQSLFKIKNEKAYLRYIKFDNLSTTHTFIFKTHTFIFKKHCLFLQIVIYLLK